jgi:hypothetical protein
MINQDVPVLYKIDATESGRTSPKKITKKGAQVKIMPSAIKSILPKVFGGIIHHNL